MGWSGIFVCIAWGDVNSGIAPQDVEQPRGQEAKGYDDMLQRCAEMLGNLPGILFHISVASRPAHAKMALRCSGWCCKKSVRSYTTPLICSWGHVKGNQGQKWALRDLLHLLYSYRAMETRLPYCVGEELRKWLYPLLPFSDILRVPKTFSLDKTTDTAASSEMCPAIF